MSFRPAKIRQSVSESAFVSSGTRRDGSVLTILYNAEHASVMVLVAFLVTGVLFSLPVVAWWLWYKFSKFCRLVNQLPGPRPLPLIGSALDVVGGCDGKLAFHSPSRLPFKVESDEAIRSATAKSKYGFWHYHFIMSAYPCLFSDFVPAKRGVSDQIWRNLSRVHRLQSVRRGLRT